MQVRKPYDPFLPFAVISTDPKIIEGHSGIYNEKLLDFLVRSLAQVDRPEAVAGAPTPE